MNNNAVIYARYSSDSQTEQSVEGQLRDCYAFAQREGLTVTGEYIDRAKTGTTDKRPDFQRMIKDAEKHQFSLIIVWKLDRFARNRYDSAIYKARLNKEGVRVVSAMENIGQGDESIILESVLEGFAEYYSKDLSKKIKRGLRESVLKGTYTGAMAPIGYKIDKTTKKLVIDEQTAPIIRYAFEQYAAGTSKREIIDYLNSKGIRNKKGGPLSYSSFQHALRNEKYIGVFRYGDSIVPDCCPALISHETFFRVQKRLDEVKLSPGSGKAKDEYILHGKIYCSCCGSPMIGQSGTGKNGGKHYYYTCVNRRRQHACSKKNERKSALEDFVITKTLEYVLTPENIEMISAALEDYYKHDISSSKAAEIKKAIGQTEARINKLTEALIEAPAAASRQIIYQKLEAEAAIKEQQNKDLQDLEITAGLRPSKAKIKRWLESFAAGSVDDPKFRKNLVSMLVNSVYVSDDQITIAYNQAFNDSTIDYNRIKDQTTGPGSDTGTGSAGSCSGSGSPTTPAGSGLNRKGELSSVRLSNETVENVNPKTNIPAWFFIDDIFGLVISRS